MMAESLAAGVLGTLLFPRAGSAVSRSNGLSRATRSNAQASLASNFFSPAPRRQKVSHKPSPAVTTIVGNVLYCQSWACPTSKEWLWRYDGPMRTLLLEELEESKAPRSGARGRRGVKSSRGRLRALTLRKESGVQFFQNSYSTSSQMRLAALPAMTEATSSHDRQDEQAAASTSSATDTFYLQECLNLIASKEMQDHLVEYQEALKKLPISGVFLSAPFLEVLHFAELLADRIDEMCAHQLEKSTIHEWGDYLLGLQLTLGKRAAASSSPPVDDRMESLLYRAYAFMGQFPAAHIYLTGVVDKIDATESPAQSCFDRTLRSYVLAMGTHQGASSAIQYLWSSQARLRNRPGADRLSFLLSDATVRHFLASVKPRHIRAIMEKCQPPLPPEFQKQLLSELGTKRRYGGDSDVIVGQHNQEVSLVQAGTTDLSQVCLEGEDSDAFLDDHDSLFQDFDRPILPVRAPRGWDFTKPSAQLLRHFETKFPARPGEMRRAIVPRRGDYYVIFNALSKGHRPDIGNMQELLQDMIRHDLEPKVSWFHQVIQACRSVNDKKGVFDTLNAMRQANIEWDLHIYSSLISFFAKIMDAKTASAIYERAIKKGIVPDLVMNNAIIYAHGRQGSYKQALDLFRTMQASQNGVDVNTYNTMMKVALLSGSPLSTAMAVFSSLKERGLAPNVHTYGTLIDAALNHDQLDIARKLYEELLEREKETGKKWINVEILTSLISGYIRAGLNDKAEEFLAEMGRKGIKPNAVTHNAILRSYGSGKGASQLAAAEKILQKVSESHSGWDIVKNARQTPLAQVYGPLLVGHMERRDIGAAEATLDKFIDSGGVPTISHLGIMLKLYRDTNQVEKAIEVWSIIMDAAKQQSTSLDLSDGKIDTQIAQITAPLSVFTEMASRAGYHSEVMQTWTELMEDGSTAFDEGNWNDFILACLRAGQVLRAFLVMERFSVLVYRKGQTNYMTLLSMRGLPDKARRERLAELPDAPYTPRPVISARQKARNQLRLADDLSDVVDNDLDSKLELLRVVNPVWKDKGPQRRVLVALLASLTHLQDGYPIRAIQIGEGPSEDVIPSSHTDFSVTHALLAAIERKCPHTMVYLNQYQNYLLSS